MKNAKTPAPKPAPETAPGEADDDAGGGAAKKRGKLKWIIIAAVTVLVLGGGGAGLHFSGLLSHLFGGSETVVELPSEPVFHDIARLTVDLKPSEAHPKPFIRLLMQAELQGESAKLAFAANETRILDGMQSHLRTLTVEDLEGGQGTERLRDDLTTIINRIIEPEVAIGVLYKEILIR